MRLRRIEECTSTYIALGVGIEAESDSLRAWKVRSGMRIPDFLDRLWAYV